MIDEREQAIHPMVSESIQHNSRTISNIRNLTSSLFGVAAGTLGLESYSGFALYLIGTFLVSIFIFVFRTNAAPNKYFHRPSMDLWFGDLFGGLSSFVLTWTLFFGLLRA